MARHTPYLIIFGFLVAFVASIAPAVQAVPSLCPDGYTELGPVLPGFFNESRHCIIDGASNQHTVNSDPTAIPCNDAYLETKSITSGSFDRRVVTVPQGLIPEGQRFMRFSYEASFINAFGSYMADPDVTSTVRSYDTLGSLIDSDVIDQGLVQSIGNLWGFRSHNGFPWFAFVHPIVVQDGGYIEIEIDAQLLLGPRQFQFAGARFDNLDVPLNQARCQPYQFPVSPNPTPTVTNTPLPTLTNTPGPTPTPPPGGSTATATATTIPSLTPTVTPSPLPTGVGGTVTPLPTNTAIFDFVTVPAYPTGTPIPISTLPTVVFSNISTPDVSGFGAITVTLNFSPSVETVDLAATIESIGGESSIIATRWFTQTEVALSFLSVTNTTGISTAVELKDEIVANIATPFVWVRIIQVYMPNTWPIISFLLLAMGWIIFNLLAKYAIGIVSEVLEVLRRIWEMIPFN